MPVLTVNGARHEVPLDPHRSLLQTLREELHLTGAKYACGEGACGACTILLDGEPVRSCVTPIQEVSGRAITTIEGLAPEGALHPVQQAFLEIGAMQCGYCTPGMIISATALLERTATPDDNEILEAMQGNVCRCCAYSRIVRAVRRAAGIASDAPVISPPSIAANTLEGRPRRPWDLTAPGDRDVFDVLPPGLMVVVAPGAGPAAWSAEGGAWIHVGEEGLVTAFTGKVDVGQDNRTALSIIVAEELHVRLEAVRLVMGDTDVCPADMGTFGSRSMADAGAVLRAGAAAACRLLDQGLEPGARRIEVIDEPPPTSLPRTSRPVGSPSVRVGALEIVTGSTQFPSDVELPGMAHGALLRPPAIGASLRAVDVSAAEAIPGIVVVQEGGLIGAVADDPSGARRAVAAIRAEWDLTPQPSEHELVGHLRSHHAESEGWGGSSHEEHGDVDGALARSEIRLDATYTTAYVAHVPLETRVAVARWDDDRVTVWTGTQVPFGVRSDIATGLGIDESLVRVIVPPTGGGFGGKHSVETAVEAAMLSRAVGRPVKVRLSREEEFVEGYFRPAAVIDVRSGVSREGSLLAWDFRNINSGSAGIGCPYDIPDRRIEFQPAESPLPQGSYRALAATANTFARESHIDEIAAACGADPVELRTRHLSDDRLVAVLTAAADRAGCGKRASGTAMGIACGIEKDARVATCVRMRATPDGPRIERIVTAFECGAIIDPDNLANQVEGATVMGLGGALFEAIHFENRRILNASMTDYRVPRFRDVPPIEVVLLDRPDLPSVGAGETPLIAVAPAIANAMFAATGARLRSLPLDDANA